MPSATPHTLQPLSFDALRIGFPVVQAALSGHSDWPMRMLARQFGASYTLHEVMLDRFVREVGSRGMRRKGVSAEHDEHPVGAQLMGSDLEMFGPAAKRLASFGFDVIDINFGCPVRSAMGGCRGGYHLGQPEHALQIVDAVRSAVPAEIPVTVKMRAGIDDTSESRDKFFEILQGAYARGAAAITVHGRTVDQKYVGPSNWSFLREVKREAGDHKVLGSGDLFGAPDVMRMFETTGVDGVTVARGAIGNPWIFAQCRALAQGEPLPPPPDVHAQRDVLLAHKALCEQAYGAEHAGSHRRRFAIKCAQSHPEYQAVRNAIGRTRTAEAWDDILTTWYRENRPGRYWINAK